ncbi:hypothetical protein BT63DRAFT_112805 [Microthyrium microscopicum]|uniref:Ilp is an apoptosis inhibitor n=1 Tax=Microthyrium microscopicum TaxID=703497 RepID=A0A6A6TVQ5_9PEZI|nr:hypothetical protein BT63DRAFT_112805 [Microthyrium microscopicum]
MTSNNNHHPSAPPQQFHPPNGSSSTLNNNILNGITDSPSLLAPTSDGSPFELLAWYPAYQSCQRYFINHAQHGGMVQAVAAFTNIRLPFQWAPSPITQLPTASSSGHSTPSSSAFFPSHHHPHMYANNHHSSRSPTTPAPAPSLPFLSLIPYIRRLVVTGFDDDGIMHGFFGNDWKKGVGPLHEIERRNYMFAAKSVGWAKVKYQYDGGSSGALDESVPFMKPLQRVQLAEIEESERSWSKWLAMEDWMVGPRAPPEDGERSFTNTGVQGGCGSLRHDGHHDDMVQDS